MASVSGSNLSFFSPNNNFTQPVNLILSDGTTTTGSTVAGAYNIEIFTTTSPGTALPGVDATAIIEGAQLIAPNEVQAGTLSSTEELLTGNVWLVDQTGGESITAATQDGVSQSVSGSAGDTITAGNGAGSSLLVDASNARGDIVVGPETIIGGGAQETVWAARGDSIVGGSGGMTVAGNGSNSPPGGSGSMTIVGGTGDLMVFDVGTTNSITGSSSGSTFIDSSYAGDGQNTITAGSGTSPVTLAGITAGNFIKIGIGDSVNGGSGGTVLVDGHAGSFDTINAGAASGITVWGGANDSVIGGSANLQFNDNVGGSNSTVIGGKGGLYAFNLGTGDSIVGGSGGTVAGTIFSNIIDDSYTGAEGNNTLVGGTASTLIVAGPNDSVVAVKASLLVDIRANLGATSAETVDLSGSKGGGVKSTTIRDDDTLGGTGTAVTLTGFQSTQDVIASATSVDLSNNFTGTSAVQNGGTLLTFNDGTTMFLSGVTDVSKVNFTQ